MDEEREKAIIIIKINFWGERTRCHNGWEEEQAIIMDEEREQSATNGCGERSSCYI